MNYETVRRVTLLLCVIGCATLDARAAESSRHCNPDLPPLLEFGNGDPVRNLADWERRREEIRRLMCETFIGSFPESVPAIVQAEVIEEQAKEDGSTRRRVRLVFDTKNRASFETWVWTPRGDGPFPVLLTAPRYYQIPWAEMALLRGYIVCLYPGVDSHHRETDYPGYDSVWQEFRAEYRGATWTEISTKAWLASRTLDYVLDPKYGYPVASGQVGIIGWSRYGKQSMIAAAFDERITSVVARSPGSPASCPYRFTSRNTFAEAPADFPSEWFLPSLRGYTGREHELPMDAHGWLALIAPRRCLIDVAHNDGCEPTFAVERAYLEGRRVYRLLGHLENLRVSYREGQHGPITDEHRRRNFEWFDLSFGQGTAKQSEFPEEFIHKFDLQAWKAKLDPQDIQVPFAAPKASDHPEDRRDRILWALGQVPEKINWDGKYAMLSAEESEMMTHDRWRVANTARMPVSFGANVRGNVYYNPTVTQPAPAVIWLHPYSHHSGYNEGYGVEGTTVYHRLAQEGFVVLAYDQCGFGLRLLEGRDFYRHCPKWSRLGRMVHDVHAAVDFLVDGNGASQGDMPAVRKDQVFVLGYSQGGMVGLYATALDERIAGVASFCGFTPLRTDTDAKSTGGIRRLWEWHALQPLLGLFDGREAEIPYDFDDVLALIAPRPCLIYSPQRDRDADFEDIKACVDRARIAWKASGGVENLTHLAPADVNRFQADQHAAFIKWHQSITK
ncbi:MAG: alpha/beta hydrolase [Planctomycetes bacterium]|nr:alpha/beta hydrolase [Planctomycetota bacterium]MBL7037770.1 alpha/beta hydrolase [Pirellulaceae bacterium]